VCVRVICVPQYDHVSLFVRISSDGTMCPVWLVTLSSNITYNADIPRKCIIIIHHLSHIVESCPMTKLNGGLSQLHSADEDAVSWLTNYGKWHAYEKKKNHLSRGKHARSERSSCRTSYVIIIIHHRARGKHARSERSCRTDYTVFMYVKASPTKILFWCSSTW